MLRYRLNRYNRPADTGWNELGLGYAIPLSVARLTEMLPDSYRLNKISGHFVLQYVVSGDLPSLKDMAAELLIDSKVFYKEIKDVGTATSTRHNRASDFELLAAVIARGEVHGRYGITYWGDECDTLHVLTCGFDWSSYRGVHESNWNNFTDTFDETGSNVKRLTASMRCRCDEHVEVWFGIEPPSLASLFAALSSGTLERLFEV
jgi:hypothetical protein